MNTKLLLLGFTYFIIGQLIIWFQSHLQFISNWAKDNPILIAVPGVAVSYVSILATRNLAEAFDGLVYPSRLIGFGIGIVTFATLTWMFLGEKIEMKSAVSIVLAFCIMLIQLFWK
jgi:multidrug transporter EmrE-like cation transporter